MAKKSDILSQKEIWKLCFGDKDKFIDFYFENRYQEDQTLLLLKNGKPAAMLTMLAVKIVIPDLRTLDSDDYADGHHLAVPNQGLAANYWKLRIALPSSRQPITFSILVSSAEEPCVGGYYTAVMAIRKGFYNPGKFMEAEAIDQISCADKNRKARFQACRA